MNQMLGLFLILVILFLEVSGTVGAEPTISLKNCPDGFVPAASGFSCTCEADNVNNSTLSLLWKDPGGGTVTQSNGNEKTLTLQFSDVAEEFNTKLYQCELVHNNRLQTLPYSPKIAEVPSQPYLKNCPEELLRKDDENASCTCMTITLGLPPALLTWDDPYGFTVKHTQTETLLSLPFTAVNDSYSGKDYRCVITQSVTGVHFGVPYKPQIIVNPNDPLVLGVRTSYEENQDVDLKCLVSGGYPDVKEVDFHCANHTDQDDETDADGNLISPLSFKALMSDHNTTCICRGFNGETNSTETYFPLNVHKEGAADDSDTVKIVVPIVVTLIGVSGTVAVAFIRTRGRGKERLDGLGD